MTKLAIKLYPNRALKDVGVFVTEDPELVPEVFYQATGVQVAEDITAWMAPKPDWARGFQHVNINYAGGYAGRTDLEEKPDPGLFEKD